MAGKEMTPSSKAAAPPATIRLVNFISEDQARPRTLASPLFPSLARSLVGRARRIGRAKPRKKISWAFWEILWNFVVRNKLQLDEVKRTRGERVEDGTAQRDKPLFQVRSPPHNPFRPVGLELMRIFVMRCADPTGEQGEEGRRVQRAFQAQYVLSQWYPDTILCSVSAHCEQSFYHSDLGVVFCASTHKDVIMKNLDKFTQELWFCHVSCKFKLQQDLYRPKILSNHWSLWVVVVWINNCSLTICLVFIWNYME
jgi:hypothetical protein